MSMPATAHVEAVRALGGHREHALRLPRVRQIAGWMLGASVGIALVAMCLTTVPARRGALLMGAAMAAWAGGIAPDFVVALGLIAAWNLAGVGPASTSLSGFSSPVWLLLISVLTLGVALNRSGLLRRVALRLLLVFRPTFLGQSVGLLVSGCVTTPLLPLTIARCALTAPLVAELAQALGYPARSRPAVGLGLAGFVGSGLLSRCFLTGATLNLIAWGLLPAEARIGWGLWALAAAPVTSLLLAGPLTIIASRFAPESAPPVGSGTIHDMLRAMGPLSRNECVAGGATLIAVIGFVLAPHLGIHSAWIACAAALVVMSTGVVTADQFKSSIDWPLLMFLGVVLSLPEMIRFTGLEAAVTDRVRLALADARSPLPALALVFLITVATRFVLSEWVAVPVLTVALRPVATALGFHPWLIAFVVLLGANMWSLPYQFASYLAFYSGSDGRLFDHRQVRMFSVAFMTLSLVAIVVSAPWWRVLGLLP